MNEPTHRQHQILETVDAIGNRCYKTGAESDIELYWELVRSGYLQNLVLLEGQFEWQFILTDTAKEYLSTFIK